MRAVLAMTALLAVVAAPRPGRADEESDLGARAVQNREFSPRHELSVGIGLLPLNAFYKGFTVGAGYTYHFSDALAWEVFQANYVLPINTELKNELQLNFAASESQFVQLDFLGSSNLIVKPLYGKFSALNRRVVHLELMFNLGLGAGISLPHPDPADVTMSAPFRLSLGPDFGIGVRGWIARFLSVRLDVRDYVLFGLANGVVDNQLSVGLSFSLSTSRSGS